MNDEQNAINERKRELIYDLTLRLISLMDDGLEVDEMTHVDAVAHLRRLLHVDQMAGEGRSLSPAEIDNLRGLAELLPELRQRATEGTQNSIYVRTREREKQLDDLLKRIGKKSEVKR